MSQELDRVLDYHQATKHHFGRFARGPGRLDWATQPNPFRDYRGARRLSLAKSPVSDSPPYEQVFFAGRVPVRPVDRRNLSQLFLDSLALSAWKQAGTVSWALRVNPSSGNLHPTEGYLLCGPVEDLSQTPMVAHYAPRDHALEVRAEFSPTTWEALTSHLPAGTFLVGLSSIHWREAWKYGERAFRYCQHDVGHAIAALSLAAAGLGWQATVLDDVGSRQLAQMLGIADPQGAEAEHPDCILAIYPQGQVCSSLSLPERSGEAFGRLRWQGKPNVLSPDHAEWSIVEVVAAATEKPPTNDVYGENLPNSAAAPRAAAWETSGRPSPSLHRIVHQRRSAVAMDGDSHMSRDAFYRILLKVLPSPGQFPLSALPWPPVTHLALFVHRIEGLDPGLYLLVRDPQQKEALRLALKDEFKWHRPPECPPDLELYVLLKGDGRALSRQLSCQQDIAADGCFSLGMIAEFEGPLQRLGPWFYRRLFWECGLIGQVLYLEAEAAGFRGTGIGCFFDDPVHQLLGLETQQYQSLYHFTVGRPVEDDRLVTHPAYPSD
jgi:SagB-type dehydrogenase family enzyme